MLFAYASFSFLLPQTVSETDDSSDITDSQPTKKARRYSASPEKKDKGKGKGNKTSSKDSFEENMTSLLKKNMEERLRVRKFCFKVLAP